MKRVRNKTNRLRVALFNYVDSSRLYCVKLNLLSNRCINITLHNCHCQYLKSQKRIMSHKCHCVINITLQICHCQYTKLIIIDCVANMSLLHKNHTPLRWKMTPPMENDPLQWKMTVTPPVENDSTPPVEIILDPTDGK